MALSKRKAYEQAAGERVSLVDNLAKSKQIARETALNQEAEAGLSLVDGLALTSIFSLVLTEVGRQLLETIAKFFLFPAAAASHIGLAISNWLDEYIEHQPRKLVRAIAQSLTAVALTIGVVGTFVAATTFAVIGPLIFAATFGLKSIYHLASAAFFWGEYIFSSTTDERKKNLKSAIQNTIAFPLTALATVGIALAMIALKPLFAIFAITAGVLVTGLSIAKLVTNKIPSRNSAISDSSSYAFTNANESQTDPKSTIDNHLPYSAIAQPTARPSSTLSSLQTLSSTPSSSSTSPLAIPEGYTYTYSPLPISDRFTYNAPSSADIDISRQMTSRDYEKSSEKGDMNDNIINEFSANTTTASSSPITIKGACNHSPKSDLSSHASLDELTEHNSAIEHARAFIDRYNKKEHSIEFVPVESASRSPQFSS
jgi:hypothetical protein